MRARRRNSAGLLVLLGGLFAAAGALAHDFWIEPASFRPAPDTRLAVGLRVGDHFDGVHYARNPYHIQKFVLVGPSGTTYVAGLPGRDPAGFVRIAEPGLHLIAYWSTHTPLVLEAERFEASAKREGLERIVALRAESGDADKPATESFFRCAKALIDVGGEGRDGYDRVLGLPLELIPERNPYRMLLGEALPLRVLYQGAPLAGVRVVARNAREPEREIAGRSDEDGRVRLNLDRTGMWMIKGVHMVAAPPELDADWESAWASLTFELPAAP